MRLRSPGLAHPSTAGYSTAVFPPFLFAVVARARSVSDEALVRRVAARDPQALRGVYDRCAGIALAVALRILRSRSEAEDVVQDAFVEIWKRAGSFDARRGSLNAWVVAIVRSRALDRVRARGSAERAVQSMQREDEVPVPLPIESAEQRQDRERILAALATLPEEQRRVLELAYFEGLTQKEIAEHTGDPLGTVKTRVRLALEKLSTVLGPTS